MKVLLLLNEKGGVGKTTLAGTLAVGLAHLGHNVLAIDSDGQGNLTQSLGFERAPGFYEFVQRPQTNVGEIIQRVPESATGELKGNLLLVPGNNETWGIASSLSRYNMVKNMVGRFNVLKSRRLFNYVVIDTQPSMTPVHEALISIATDILLPTDAETFSALGGLPTTLEHIHEINAALVGMQRKPVNILGIVPNKYRARTTLHQLMVKRLQESYGSLVWDPIPLRTSVAESQALGEFLVTSEEAEGLNSTSHLWNFVARVEELTSEDEVTA